jgi:hypothetical protein
MKIDRSNEELYYLDGTKVVFTPKYHLQRGYCCGSKCRHCPYEPKYLKGNTNYGRESIIQTQRNDGQD